MKNQSQHHLQRRQQEESRKRWNEEIEKNYYKELKVCGFMYDQASQRWEAPNTENANHFLKAKQEIEQEGLSMSSDLYRYMQELTRRSKQKKKKKNLGMSR